MQEFYAVTIELRTLWAVAGFILSIFALIKVLKHWTRININSKVMWWIQFALTLNNGLFILWATFALRGFYTHVPWNIAVIFILSSLYALPSALWLLNGLQERKICVQA